MKLVAIKEGKKRVFRVLRKGLSDGMEIFVHSIGLTVVLGSLFFLMVTSGIRLVVQALLIKDQRVFGFPLEMVEWWASCTAGAACFEVYWPGVFLDLVFSTTVSAALINMIHWGLKDNQKIGKPTEEIKAVTGWLVNPLGRKKPDPLNREETNKKIARKKQDPDSVPSGPHHSKN